MNIPKLPSCLVLSGFLFLMFLSIAARGADPAPPATPGPVVETQVSLAVEPDSPVPVIHEGVSRAVPAADRPTITRLEKYEFVRCLPSQPILFNETIPPPTRLDLTGTYESHAGFEGGDLKYEIVLPGNEKIVRPILEGKTLVLNWCGIGETELTLRITNLKSGHILHETLRVKVFRPDYLMMFCTLLGGVGIFLLGMKNMSEGVQMVAGNRLRYLIGTLTDNRFKAVLVGIVTTGLIQSSSVTTVMVVGFINSQVMALSQGIGVIMGANIGTTLTAWILSIGIDKYGLPMIGVASSVYMFAKRDNVRFFAMSLLGLGFIFFGLELMQSGLRDLRELPDFTLWMQRFSADTYWGVLKCAAVGCILTVILQSSSATIGITFSLAVIGVIRFDTAMALVLGENIGTTITAILASIGMSTNARRAAMFHVAFNITGVIWVSALFLPLNLPGIVAGLIGMDPVHPSGTQIKIAIALTHTLFNVSNTILFFPFVRIAANLLIRYIPDRAEKEGKSRLTGLNIRLLETAAISIERSRIEVLRMANCCSELAEKVRAIGAADMPDRKAVTEAFKQEEVLDSLQDEIIAFTANLLSGNISHDVAETARNQLKMADEIESIGDYLIVIMKSNLKLKEGGLIIPELEATEMAALHEQVETYLKTIFDHYARRQPRSEILTIEHPLGKSITATVKSIRDRFIKRMSEEKFDPHVIVAISSQLNAYRRVREHGRNAAEAIAWIR